MVTAAIPLDVQAEPSGSNMPRAELARLVLASNMPAGGLLRAVGYSVGVSSRHPALRAVAIVLYKGPVVNLVGVTGSHVTISPRAVAITYARPRGLQPG